MHGVFSTTPQVCVHSNVTDVSGVDMGGQLVYASAIEQEEFDDDGEPVGDDEDYEYSEHVFFRQRRQNIDGKDTFSDDTDEDQPSTAQLTVSVCMILFFILEKSLFYSKFSNNFFKFLHFCCR
jgi:hypothetical protein